MLKLGYYLPVILEVIFILNKRLFSYLFTFSLTLGMVFFTATNVSAEYTRITNREVVSGSDYTNSPALASQLDAIFDGNAGIYRDSNCTKLVDTTLGTSPVRNNGVYMYVGEENSEPLSIGTSCWIYANGVYHTLFGETTGSGYAGENSEKLDLRGTGSRCMSYENFKDWGVRQSVGALIRAGGHSMILLEYNSETYTILDGNSDGRGLVSISTRSWDQGYSYVEYIIQPKIAYYAQQFASGMCGEDLVWAVDDNGTLTIAGSGELTYAGWRSYSASIEKVVIAGEGIRLNDGLFSSCYKLKDVVFEGTIPAISSQTFHGVTTRVWYPISAQISTKNNFGGELTWIAYDMTGQKFHEHNGSIYSIQHCVICSDSLPQLHPNYLDATVPTEPVATSWK